ncbi:MAG: glycosyltransferase family 9 protein [Bacteroidota bacterium]
MVKFLIIRFSSIGDIVLTTPVIRCLKEQVVDSEIHFLTKRQYVEILHDNPYVHKVHVLSEDFPELLKELKFEKFDYIIDLHNNIRSKRVQHSLKLISFTVNKINFQKYMAVRFKQIHKLPPVNIVNRYLNTVKAFDVINDEKGLDYFIPDSDIVKLSDLPSEFQKAYLGFVIGAKHFTKKLPADKIASICNGLKMPIVLIGGEDDNETGEYIKKQSSATIFNSCGKFSVNQSASLIKQAGLIVSNDTGMMHIAAALKKTIISVWGNTIPEFGMFPYLPGINSEIVEIKGLKCRPCSKIGYTKCPKKHFRCMNDIDEKTLAEKINNIFSYE